MIAYLQRRLWPNIDFDRLITTALVMLVLGLSATLGRQASTRLITEVVVNIGGIAAFITLSRRPVLGLPLLILVSIYWRWTLPTGTNVPFNMTIVLGSFLVVLWFLRMAVVEKSIRLIASKANLPALMFVLACTISLAGGGIKWIPNSPPGASEGAQFGQWLLYTLPILIMLFTANQVKDRAWLEKITWVFLISGSTYLFSRLFPPLTFLLDSLFAHVKAYGSVFWIWFTALALGQLMFNHDLSARRRGLLVVFLAAAIISAVFQSRGWISGWGMMLIAILILVWLHSRRLGVAITLIAAVAILSYFSVIKAEVWNPVEQYSANSRAATLPILFALINANPILGLGPANYYHYTPMLPILGWYVKFNSHNNYMDILAQFGLLGMVTFGWLSYTLMKVIWRLRTRVQDGFSLGFVNAGFAALIATLVSGVLGDWFLPFVYNIGTRGFRSSILAWIFVGGLLALDIITRKELEEQQV